MSVVEPSVVAHLEARGVRFCLIGAMALAARGYARFSADVDLLTVDRQVLNEGFWLGFPHAPERRWGDPTDPLQGVVRWTEPFALDLVVGKDHAARFAIETAERDERVGVPVPTALALVLNKLEAGGHKDRLDVVELVRAQRILNGAAWLADVPAHLPQLSPEARVLWTRLQPDLARL